LLEKLVAKENYIKKLIKILDLSKIKFDKIIKNIEETIQVLQY